MSQKYDLDIRAIFEGTVTIQADSLKEAKEKAEKYLDIELELPKPSIIDITYCNFKYKPIELTARRKK